MTMRITILPVTQFQQNCSIIVCDDTRKAAIVDPGGDLDAILETLRELEVEPEKILITHAHIDHAGATADLAERLNLPIEGPARGDQSWIDQLPQQSRMFGFPAARSFTPDSWLDDGDRVSVGNQQFDVIHCPGHTPGHVVFVHPIERIAIVGDVLFEGSIGRTDFPGGSHPQLVSSIREKLFPLGDDIVFIPGHGPTSTFGQERTSNPFVGDRYVS